MTVIQITKTAKTAKITKPRNRSNQVPLLGCSTPIRDQTVEQRLTAIGFTENAVTGCREWNGRLNKDGYGVLSLARAGLHEALVHRVVFELAHGDLAEGQVVRHRCDNASCSAIEDLLAGTPADNVNDMFSRGRDRWSNQTHCDQGHAFTASAFRFPDGSRCRLCYIERSVRSGSRTRFARLGAAWDLEAEAA